MIKTYNFSKYLCIFLIFLTFSYIFADERTEPIDVFIVLDKSLSMVEEIDAVTDYVNDEIVNGILRPDLGDYILIIQFFGEAKTLLSMDVQTDFDVKEIKTIVREIHADGYYTDIGNALDALNVRLTNHPETGRRKYLLLITDGVQEAPPRSAYYSEDGSFNHRFLENTKTIQKEGWKIHILGIGQETATKEVAEALGGTYTEVSENPSKEELKKSTKKFLGRLEVTGSPYISSLNKNKEGFLNITVSPYDLEENQQISVHQVLLLENGSETQIGGPYQKEVSFEKPSKLKIPVKIESSDSEENTNVEIRFIFSDNTSFTPSSLAVTLKGKNFLQKFGLILLLIIILIAAALVLLLVLGKNNGLFAKSMEVEVEIGTDGKEVQTFAIKEAGLLYICEGMQSLKVSEKNTGDLIAKVKRTGEKLTFEPVLEKRILAGDLTKNILNQKIRIKDRYSKLILFQFRNK